MCAAMSCTEVWMLTHLEVDGFKNLLGFAADFGPYTCIAGPNAVGKSNIFDAIHFLSLLADMTFSEAAAGVRSTDRSPSDVDLLFFDGRDDLAPRRMRLAAEMIVPRYVEDDFGRQAEAMASYLRYEIELEYVGPSGGKVRSGGLRLRHESLTNLRAGDAVQKMPWLRGKKAFRDAVIFNNRKGGAFISTTVEEDDEATINVHQEGGSRGQPRKSPAARAPRTLVSTTTTTESPTILAARNEMRRWRLLALEPSAMRQPDEVTNAGVITANGAHLAAALLRMADGDSGASYSRVAAEAAALTDIRRVDVDVDERRELLTLEAAVGGGDLLPARNLSDGTLRFLALCIILVDPEFDGVICMEEPENGIHPARIGAMVDLVRDLAVGPEEAPGPDNPLRQVIVNTHSPLFVRKQRDDDLVVALTSTVSRGGHAATTVGLHPMVGSWRAETRIAQPALTGKDVEDYLVSQPGDQLVHDLGIDEGVVT
jgi:predicted ATPase